MPVTVFTLDKKDATKRIPYQYNDNHERYWCEAAELADAELWQEAEDKINAYLGLDEGFIRGSRDTMLNAKIAVGLAKTKLEPRLFDNALQAMQMAKRYDDGSSVDVFADWFYDLSQGYIKMKIPAKANDEEGEDLDYFEADYAKVSTTDLVLVAKQILQLFIMAYDNDVEIMQYNDNTHDSMQMIIDELLMNRNETEKARPIVEKLLKVDAYGGFFKDIAEEEWNKKLSATKEESARPSKKSHTNG